MPRTPKPWAGPPPIYVFVTVAPTPRNGLTKPVTGRVGTCHEEKEIAGLIAEDLREMSNTYGGLIESAGTAGRTYRAFRAQWTELDVAAVLKKAKS